MLITLGVVYFLYAVVVLVFSGIYQSISKGAIPADLFKGRVSVIVPFRNEENNISALVKALRTQTYTNFEVIFVNDHSTDQTLQYLEEELHLSAPFEFKTLSLTIEKGKKAAIAKGVEQSTGEVVLTTDADCWFDKDWIGQMTKPFILPETHMVTGPVVLEGQSFFQKCQRIEFGALLAVSATLVAFNRPTMANGANLAYRKSTFEQVGGYKGIDQTPSGDDELLLMKVNSRYKKAVRFCNSKNSVVHTLALSSLADFVQQRKRWASKWKVGLRLNTIITAFLVYIVQIIHVVIITWAIVDYSTAGPLLKILGFKLLAELLLIHGYFRSLQQKYSIFHFLALQTFYPFYVLYFGLVSNFGNFQWKGRSFKI